jgi:LasA protease
MPNHSLVNRRLLRTRVLAIGLLAATVLTAPAGAAGTSGEPFIHNSRFVYSIEEKLDFDLEAYLRAAAPHLVAHAEVISHWSAYYTVSPRVVLSLMELETAQISSAAPSLPDRPFAGLSEAKTLPQQVEDVLRRLSELFYESPAGPDGLRAPQAAQEALRRLLGSDRAPAELRSRYESLFPAERPLDEPRDGPPAAAKATPPPGLLQLPYPVGESWYFGGAHTFDGQDPGPKSSLDFTRDRESWGDNTSNTWVVAAHGGTAVVYSSCFVEVVGPNGWSTSYYHLDNVVVASGQTVGWDQRLANYADNLDQALCNGGFSTGPHVHFSLLRNGQYMTLQNAQLSRYRVQVGRFSYDWDCGYFWLQRGGVRHCAWDAPLLNDGVVVRPGAPRDLTAEALSTTEIRLEWSDRSNSESGFEIERRVPGAEDFRRIATTRANVGHYVDEDLSSGSTYAYRVRAVNSAGASEYSNDALATTFVEDPQPCVPADDRLCLNGERFAVEVAWRGHDGNTGRGRTVPFGSADSGLLWFFAADNWEMLIKVLDGCGVNDRFWVFAAATTDVEYILRVIDSVTGRAATYFNPLGNASPAITDTEALAVCGGTSSAAVDPL